MPLSSLSENALHEILNDLPEPFKSLPPVQRLELWSEINELWSLYVRFDPGRNEKVPHKLLQRWKQINATNEKLSELVQGFEPDMAFEIDLIKNDQQRLTPNPYEIREEMPSIGNIGDHFARQNLIVPSDYAKRKVEELESALRLLRIIADSAITFEQNYKNSTRKHNRFRYGLIECLSLIYKKILGKEPTSYRDGPWCLFLSEILTVLEGKQTTPDAAYEIWLEVTKLSPLSSKSVLT
jgi:hypothetical protein